MQVPAKHFVNGNGSSRRFQKACSASFSAWAASGAPSACSGRRRRVLDRRRLCGRETKNPSYEEVCSGLTNHAEVVQVVFDPRKLTYDQLLKVFWKPRPDAGHAPG